MTISRRPKRRASNENAPGPRKNRAAAMAVANAIAGFVASKLEVGSESAGTALLRLASAARTHASGVRNPTSRRADVAIKTKATAPIRGVRSCHLNKYSAPWANSVAPRTPRSSNKPAPGLPLGKVENIRCSEGLLGARSRPIVPISRVCGPIQYANP
jgi:hypothetical protein